MSHTQEQLQEIRRAREDKRKEELKKLAGKTERLAAQAQYAKAQVMALEAGRRSFMRVGDTEIVLDMTQAAKLVAITGLAIAGIILGAYLVKVGVQWFARFVLGDGSSITASVDADTVGAVID
jgi:hypothetical protein